MSGIFENADGCRKRAPETWYERGTKDLHFGLEGATHAVLSEDLTFAKIISVGKGRKNVNLKIILSNEVSLSANTWTQLTCAPK